MDPNAVADHLISFGNKLSGEPLTQLDIQKLVYYSQGWHLALCEEPIFNEDIYAWRNGPVLKSLWKRFREFGAKPIGSGSIITEHTSALSEGAQKVIRMVWERYSPNDAGSLVGFTHFPGTPWRQVREAEGITLGMDSNILIGKDLLKEYFLNELRASLVPRSFEAVDENSWSKMAG